MIVAKASMMLKKCWFSNLEEVEVREQISGKKRKQDSSTRIETLNTE